MLLKQVAQRGIVERILTLEDLVPLAASQKTINIMMGQTFDSGQPLDLMKYALFIMNLSDALAKDEAKPVCTLVLADHFMPKHGKQDLNARIDYLNLLNKVYNGNIGNVLSSDLSQTREYKNTLDTLKNLVRRDSKFRESMAGAVPPDKRSDPKEYEYPVEELATVQAMQADIKIGPTYEIVYDAPARNIFPVLGFKNYVGIHLTNGVPLGNPVIPEAVAKEVEEFGVLPYKHNSKKLAEFRIDPINDSEEKIGRLIKSSNSIKAILDVLVIAELAKQRLEHNNVYFLSSMHPSDLDETLLSSKHGFSSLKELALNSLTEFVLLPLMEGYCVAK